MKERLLLTTTALFLVCYGCRNQENEGLSAVAASAGKAVVSTARLKGLVENPTDSDALISMTRIYTDLSAVANAGRGGAGVFTDFLTQKAPLDECVTMDGSVITYDNCSVSNGTIDGTLSSNGDEIDIDLMTSVQGAGAVGSLIVHMHGGIAVTATSLGGSLTYDTVIQGVDGYPDGLSFTIFADYIDITLDEVECPLSGFLVVEQEFLGESTGVVEGTFGPACGDVRLSE
jgi:hypothetical protein